MMMHITTLLPFRPFANVLSGAQRIWHFLKSLTPYFQPKKGVQL